MSRRGGPADSAREGASSGKPPRERIDKWLWRARCAKTRSLAAKLVSAGHVRVNGKKIDDPARGVLIGDVLTVAMERDVRVMRILDFGERRGPASEARGLYESVSEDAGAEAPFS